MTHRDLVVAFFPSRSTLSKALDHLVTLEDVQIERALALMRASTGELLTVDDEIGPAEGSIAGTTVGAALAALGMVGLGALALPGVGAIVALGASALVGGLIGNATGRVVANVIDNSIDHAELELITNRLQSGHAALVLELDTPHISMERLQAELKPYRAEIVERIGV
jgi:uncharacterized membrane protein